MKTNTMNHESKQPTVRSLDRVMEWDLNPRRGIYRDMIELKESLEREGLQDAIHVWERTDGDYLLKGHRRTRAMKQLGWSECLQVVHHFEDERDAFKFLLEDHGHTVPLDAEEKIVAIETGVKLGMTAAEIAPMMGVTEERAQLWFDLGEMLPQNARAALASGELSVNTAELLMSIDDNKQRRDAAQMILKDMETGEVMAHGQAKAFIQARYLLPEKWRKEWLIKETALKKKKKVSAGYQFVEWSQRLEFVLGESGQPQPEFELGESFYPRDAEGRTWELVALENGVPVYVCAAPRHAEGFVTLVNAAMMRDALSVKTREAETEAEPEQAGSLSHEGKEQAGSLSHDASKADVAKELRAGLKVWLGAIYEHLVASPTDVMTKGPWLPLYDFLAHWTTDVDAGALEAWRGITTREDALAFMTGDKVNRAPLRMALMLLLCAESDASSEPMKVIREVGAALGLDAKKLDKAAAKAGKAM